MWILSKDVHDKVQPRKAQPNPNIKLFWYHVWRLNEKNQFQSRSFIHFPCSLDIIYFQNIPCTGDTESLHKKTMCNQLRFTCYEKSLWIFGIFCIFLQCLLLKAELKIKAPLSLQYELRWIKHFTQDKVPAQGKNDCLGFGFCSCSWKQKSHPFLAYSCMWCNSL